jgi:hypothetical protein
MSDEKIGIGLKNKGWGLKEDLEVVSDHDSIN